MYRAGNVLRQARRKLEAFWTATCTSEGTFAWQAAQSFAVALMKTMQVLLGGVIIPGKLRRGSMAYSTALPPVLPFGKER